MSSSRWLERDDRPRSVEELSAISWSDFEAFALEVVGRLYAPDGIILHPTGAGPDGGRDAEGTLRLGSIADHALSLTLWVEVKQHRRSIGRQEVGGHIFAAIGASANIIVIVSCSGFSRNFHLDVDRFSQRTGIRYQLITGSELLVLADRLTDSRLVSSASEGAVLAMPATTAPSLKIDALYFSATPSLRTGMGLSWIPVSLGTPFFAIVRFEFRSQDCRDIEISLDCSHPEITPVPLSRKQVRLAGPIEQFSSVFLLRTAAAGSLKAADFQLHVRVDGEPSRDLVARPLARRGVPLPHIEFIRPAIPYVPTTAQAEAAREITLDCQRWRREGGVMSLGVEAAAGVGKSALLNVCRLNWLGDGVREIVLDGETEATVWDVFYAIFTHMVPVDAHLLSARNVPAFAKWLEGAGAPPSVALRLARNICSNSKDAHGFSPGELQDLLVVLLRRLSAESSLVLIFEDLHKVGGSVLRLLHAAIRALGAHHGARILFCFTSRFLPHGEADDGEREAWSLERERLLGRDGTRRYRLDLPGPADAKAILAAAIDHLYPEMAEDILDRAGTSPFGLTEVIRYLQEADVLREDDVSGRLVRNHEADLRRALKDPALLRSTATDQRLALLRARLPDWASELLDLAACVGREFDLERLLGLLAAAPQAGREIDMVIGQLVQNGVLNATNRSVGHDWRFEHDLIREAALRRLAGTENRARHLRLVRALLADGQRWPEPVKLSLVYQSGQGDAFASQARAFSEDLGASGYPYEAAGYLALESAVLDPSDGAVLADDPVFRVVPRPSTSTRVTPAILLNVKRRLFEMLARVSGGTGEAAERLITEVRMLAAQARDRSAAALAARWDGDLNISTGDPAQATSCFREAQALYAASTGDQTDGLFEAMLGEGIALRLLGQTAESAAQLSRALAVNPSDARSQIRFHANYGALFFYTDPETRREHWSLALDIARQAKLEDLAVHMDLDLASLDIIDRRLADARERLDRLATLAAERRYENSLMRALVMTSGLDLLEGWPEAALSQLDEARRLGYAHDSGARLWKVHANSASAYEMLGDMERAYHEDRHMVSVLKAVAWERRIAVAPANLMLRARHEKGGARFQALATTIPPAARSAAGAILAAADSGVPLTGRFPQEHLFELVGRRRFIAV